jgi:hypothetical protein
MPPPTSSKEPCLMRLPTGGRRDPTLDVRCAGLDLAGSSARRVGRARVVPSPAPVTSASTGRNSESGAGFRVDGIG